MDIRERDKFQNHAGESPLTLCRGGFSQEPKSQCTPDKPEAHWRCDDWADIAVGEESAELPDEMIQDLQNAPVFPN